MFKEILSKARGQEREVEFNLGPISVTMSADRLRSLKLMEAPVGDIDKNLERAEHTGIKPLSLRDIYSQVGEDELRNLVLFDANPGALITNRWRIIEKGNEENPAKLQLCGRFGNYDVELMPPIEVPLDTPLFTGVTIQSYEIGGMSASLAEVVHVVKENHRSENSGASFGMPATVDYLQESILFSDSEGNLLPHDEHPFFEN